MKELKQFLNETTLSRVFRHFKNPDIPVAIITAFRGEYTTKENLKRNRILATAIKSAGYGYVFVDGGWVEDGVNTVKEDSILIVGDANDGGKLKGLLRKWVVQWEQDAALFKDEGGTELILIEKGGKEVKIGNNFTTKKLETAFTQLRGRGGRVFSFEAAYTPQNWLGRKLTENT